MINLLPKKEKRRLYREYLIRLATMYIFFVVIISIVALVLLAPSYYLVHLKENILEKQAETYIDSSGDIQNTVVDSLADIQGKVIMLSENNDNVPLHEIISTILSGRDNGIAIKNIAYRKIEEEGEFSILTIKGIADRRESLRTFSQHIEEYENVEDVDLPVSNLAQDRNINFEINIRGIF